MKAVITEWKLFSDPISYMVECAEDCRTEAHRKAYEAAVAKGESRQVGGICIELKNPVYA